MDTTVLLRRPLPNTNSDEQLGCRVKSSNKKNERKDSKEKVEKYWSSFVDTDSDAYPSFHYANHSHEHLYCYRPRGPNPFPRRKPKQLPRLYKKPKVKDTESYNSSCEFLSHCRLDLGVSDLDCDKRQIDYISSNTIELPHNVSWEEEKFNAPINEVFSETVVELEEKGAWKQILLEHQLLEIDRLLNESEERPYINADRFCSAVHLRDGKVDIDEDDDLSPRINSFEVTKKPSGAKSSESLDLVISYKEISGSSRALKENSRALPNERTVLDLRASFADFLPNIDSKLMHYLASVNLSFNYFTTIPEQLYRMRNLVSLNMRNNPLSLLPNDIAKMKKLRYLNFSFCKLIDINVNLFSLTNLQALNLSYNLLTTIHEDINKLTALREFSVDGNMIGFFPRTILDLNLHSLRCNLNFVNKVFWRDSCPRIPQQLMDVAMDTLVKNDLLIGVPDTIQEKVLHGDKCPYCDTLISGSGIPAMKPAMELFGVKNLPLLFFVCSRACKLKFQRCKELPLLNV